MDSLSLRPSGHTAVMAGRAPTPPDALDYFPTPPWAARAGGELIQRLDPGPWSCWEPACGEGHMAHGLADYFEGGVWASDVFDYGAGHPVVDFLDPASLGPVIDGQQGGVDWIVTNPPFVKGEAFVRGAWPRARRGIAMLLRLQFIEGAGRWRLFMRDCPLAVLAPFAERVPMVKGRWDPDASSATAYAWFVWLKPEVGPPPGRFDMGAWPLLMLIAPGAKARLSRPSDLERFVGASEAPLLDFDNLQEEGGKTP